jgi:hypothetical protein
MIFASHTTSAYVCVLSTNITTLLGNFLDVSRDLIELPVQKCCPFRSLGSRIPTGSRLPTAELGGTLYGICVLTTILHNSSEMIVPLLRCPPDDDDDMHQDQRSDMRLYSQEDKYHSNTTPLTTE